MNHSRGKVIRIQFSLAGLFLILYLCNRLFCAFVSSYISNLVADIIYDMLFFLVLFLLILIKGPERAAVPVLVYIAVTAAISITYLIHPEYESWFNHSYYGIRTALLSPRCGIWAFLVFWFVKDEEKLLSYFNFSMWLLFFFLVLQFYLATKRGYWRVAYSKRADSSMDWGYSMLLPVAFFGAYSYLKNRLYYIPFIAGAIMILIAGSRGATIWPIAIFLFMLPFKWSRLTIEKRILLLSINLIGIILILIIENYYDWFITLLKVYSSRLGIKSRIINAMLAGELTDPNGRDRIYELAFEYIKTGGPLGRGVFGDRACLSSLSDGGYAHNIFLELLLSFGYVGGTILSVLLIVGTIKLYKRCNTTDKQILFITALISSMKLIFSSSFWYLNSFWMLVAMMLGWKDEHPKPGKSVLITGKIRGENT